MGEKKKKSVKVLLGVLKHSFMRMCYRRTHAEREGVEVATDT